MEFTRTMQAPQDPESHGETDAGDHFTSSMDFTQALAAPKIPMFGNSEENGFMSTTMSMDLTRALTPQVLRGSPLLRNTPLGYSKTTSNFDPTDTVNLPSMDLTSILPSNFQANLGQKSASPAAKTPAKSATPASPTTPAHAVEPETESDHIGADTQPASSLPILASEAPEEQAQEGDLTTTLDIDQHLVDNDTGILKLLEVPPQAMEGTTTDFTDSLAQVLSHGDVGSSFSLTLPLNPALTGSDKDNQEDYPEDHQEDPHEEAHEEHLISNQEDELPTKDRDSLYVHDDQDEQDGVTDIDLSETLRSARFAYETPPSSSFPLRYGAAFGGNDTRDDSKTFTLPLADMTSITGSFTLPLPVPSSPAVIATPYVSTRPLHIDTPTIPSRFNRNPNLGSFLSGSVNDTARFDIISGISNPTFEKCFNAITGGIGSGNKIVKLAKTVLSTAQAPKPAPSEQDLALSVSQSFQSVPSILLSEIELLEERKASLKRDLDVLMSSPSMSSLNKTKEQVDNQENQEDPAPLGLVLKRSVLEAYQDHLQRKSQALKKENETLKSLQSNFSELRIQAQR